MCKIIAVANQKGGRKNNYYKQFRYRISKTGKKVLLLDADVQGSLMASLGFTEPDKLEVTLANALEKVIKGEETEPDYGILSRKPSLPDRHSLFFAKLQNGRRWYNAIFFGKKSKFN